MASKTVAKFERLREHIRTNPLLLWRNKHSVTLSELSTLTGLSISTIQRYENGANSISPEKIEVFTGVFGEDYDLFVEEYSDWYDVLERLK